MIIPEKAIICAPTLHDAMKLHEFLNGEKEWHINLEEWELESEDTCYDLTTEADGTVLSADRGYYQDRIDEFIKDPDEYYYDFIPEEEELRFISVDEFIFYCENNGSLLEEDDLNIVVEEALL